MNLFARLFGSTGGAAGHSQLHDQSSHNASASQNATRRELLRVVLRDTLGENGIPAAWIGAEMLRASGQGREPGVHLRLLIRHWEPRLLPYTVALQNSLQGRLLAFDPTASGWFAGISWQYALEGEPVCPDMPAPSTWAVPAAGQAAPAPARPHADPRAELQRLFAARDAKLKRYADATGVPDTPPNFEATQPMFRPTEPAGL
jgi:hypothetical protein